MRPRLLLPCLLLLAACPPKPARPERPDLVTITILSTNDLHGQLDPVLHRTAGGQSLRVGGARALAATVAELRAKNPGGTILVDAGDFMQGTLLSGHHEGAPVRELFHLLGHDAVAVGNHEFDFGPVGSQNPNLTPGLDNRGALMAWARQASFPVLAANITDLQGRPLAWPNVRSSVMLTRKGVRVGLLGLTTPATARSAMPAMVRGLRFLPLLSAAEREASRLRAQGAQVVVAVAHAGGRCPTRDADQCTGELFVDLLARLGTGLVDVVVAGHTHQSIWHRHRGVLVVEACSHGKALGRVELTVDRRTGRVVAGASRALPPVNVCHDVFSATGDCDPPPGGAGGAQVLGSLGPSGMKLLGAVVENPLMARHRRAVSRAGQMITRYRASILDLEQQKLAVVARTMGHDRFSSSEVASYFARAMLESVPGADFAVLNSGGVRASLPAGIITWRHVFEAMPFENRVATARLTGAELRRLLEVGTASSFGVFQVAGLRMKVRCTDPVQVVSLTTIGGQELERHKLYTVVLNDYLLTGGDGVGVVMQGVMQSRKKIHGDLLIRDVIVRKLRASKAPINSADDPVISASDPPVVTVDGPCREVPRRRRALCR